MSCRLAGVSNLIAAEGKYHLECYARFQRNSSKVARSNQVQDSDSDPRGTCFEETMSLLVSGQYYSLKAVWTYFSRRLELHYHLDPGLYRGNKFKEKIQCFLHNKVSFVQPMNPPESLLIVSTNLSESVLRSLLKVPNLEPGDDERCSTIMMLKISILIQNC